MKFFTFIFLLLSLTLLAQEEDSLSETDTLQLKNIPPAPQEIMPYSTNTSTELPFTGEYNYYKNPYESPGGLKLYSMTKKMSGNTGLTRSSAFNKTALIYPLLLQNKRDEDFETFMMILGLAQTAAVGYAAYKHIEKFGLRD